MSGMKVLSLVEFSKHCAFHQCSAQNAALMLLSSSSAVPYHPNSDLTQNAYMGAQWGHLMHKIDVMPRPEYSAFTTKYSFSYFTIFQCHLRTQFWQNRRQKVFVWGFRVCVRLGMLKM